MPSPTAIILTSPTNTVGIINIATLTFDSTVEEYSPRIDWTDHPVEKGQDVTDHAQVKPLDFTLRGTVTETTFAHAIPVTFSLTSAPSGAQRLLDAYHFLQNCEGKIVIVQTARWGAIDNCGITSYRHAVDLAGRVTFTVGVRQIRIATSSTIAVPPLKTVVPGASTAANVGSQATRTPTEGQKQTTAKFGANTVGTSDIFANLWNAL